MSAPALVTERLPQITRTFVEPTQRRRPRASHVLLGLGMLAAALLVAAAALDGDSGTDTATLAH